MVRTMVRLALLVNFIAVTILASAQATSPVQPPSASSGSAPSGMPTVQGPVNPPGTPKPPDMVCFGYGPNWSIQFVNGAAQYLGINQPDQVLLGDFYYVPQEKSWEWHRANGLAPMNGSFDLSATIQKQSCQDPVRKATFPYSAQVNLPQGDMVSGCCRKLRPGEAAIGKHGLPPQPGSSSGSSTTTAQPGSSQSGAQQNKPKPQ